MDGKANANTHRFGLLALALGARFALLLGLALVSCFILSLGLLSLGFRLRLALRVVLVLAFPLCFLASAGSRLATVTSQHNRPCLRLEGGATVTRTRQA